MKKSSVLLDRICLAWREDEDVTLNRILLHMGSDVVVSAGRCFLVINRWALVKTHGCVGGG